MKENKIRIGIVDNASFLGEKLIQLLIRHPQAELIFIFNKTYVGQMVQSIYKEVEEENLYFSNASFDQIDILFINEDFYDLLKDHNIPLGVKIISLSGNFRLKNSSVFQDRQFVYGLPALNKVKIEKAEAIAIPGCFAMSVELSLLPVCRKNLLREVVATCILGSTVAQNTITISINTSGQKEKLLTFKDVPETQQNEIAETLQEITKNPLPTFHFASWQGNFERGVFITLQMKCFETLFEMVHLFEEFYKDHPFVKICKEPVFLEQVINTNYCFINLEKVGDILMIHSVLDNLVKGGSGTAVQNMNLMFGLDESLGLK